MYFRYILFSIHFFLSYGYSIYNTEQDDSAFPPNFILGTATSAFQIEGAWNVHDKAESVWDHFTHYHPEKIGNRDNADIACNSYYKYKEDVQLIKQLGLNHYRFSISWPRILPTGYANVVSKEGIKYYHDLLDELEKYNITPSVTVYHWDHPQLFQEIGGWTNEQMVDLYGEYARVIFREFGHRVKIFYTINEPNVVCSNGYYGGAHAPGLKAGRHIEYLCNHNILKAHARAYHIYNDEFRAKQKGKIGIVINCSQHFPIHANDTESEDIAFQFMCGRYAHPIFSKTGDYPEVFKKRVAENSAYEGLTKSRLPTFSTEWINYIKGSSDFFGLNHYATNLVEPAPKPENTIYANDDGILYSLDPKWPKTNFDEFRIVPEGFRALLNKIKRDYDNPPVLVTESGLAADESLEDNIRIQYYSLYMQSMLNAIYKDGCNVIGYFFWSLLDNFEWGFGYSMRFGLYHVDLNHPNRTRTARKSTRWVQNVAREHKLLPIH